MDILGTDNSRIATSVEEAKAANRASGIRRALDRMHGFFFHDPDYLPEEPIATVTDINEAHTRHQAEVVTEVPAALVSRPVPIDAEGKVVDMAQHRRVQEARAEVDAARASLPQPELSSAEDMLQR